MTVLSLLDVGPVRVVAPERRVDLEPARQLREDPDLLRTVERHGIGLLDARGVVDDIAVEALVVEWLPCVLAEISPEVVHGEDVHRVPLALGEPGVLDALGDDLILGGLDPLRDLREERHGVHLELAHAPGPLEDPGDGTAREADPVLELGERVGQVVNVRGIRSHERCAHTLLIRGDARVADV